MGKRHTLQDRDEPNLLEDIFPYHSVPRITFSGPVLEEIDGQVVRFDPADLQRREIVITDTSFRDGQQARPPYATEQVVRLYDMLSQLSGPNGVVRWTEFFLYTNKDREAVDKCRALGRRYPEITGWIRADRGDFRLVTEMGLAESGMLTSCSDYHIFHKQRQTRREAFDTYLGLVKDALSAGVRLRCHMEDITRADIDGFVLPFVEAVMELSEQVPEHLKVKIRLCDTMGYGVTYPGAALPRSIPKLIYRITHDAGVPSERLEWHGHNDFHKVHVNAVTAWLYGANAVNTTLFGFGERTGNPPLEGALVEYAGLKGTLNGADLRMVTEIAEYMRSIGVQIPHHYPLAGANFNRTMAGIHLDGLRRDERVYNIFDTRELLGQPPRIAITDKSGVEGIVLWVNQFLGLSSSDGVSLTKVVKLARWVRDQYEVEGRLTGISDQELEAQVAQHLPELYEQRKSKVESPKSKDV